MANKKNWWSIPNVKAYLVFQKAPNCFTETQWVEWKKYALLALAGTADRGSGRTELPPHCGDCTPMFQSLMKACGRCAHHEVKFRGEKPYVNPTPIL